MIPPLSENFTGTAGNLVAGFLARRSFPAIPTLSAPIFFARTSRTAAPSTGPRASHAARQQAFSVIVPFTQVQLKVMAFSSRNFSGRFWALVFATFLGFLGIGAVLPMLAPHIRYKLHGTDQDVGLVIGVFSFVALAGRLVAGPLADRRGRKISFLTGLFCCGLAGIAYLLPLGIAGAYLGRILQGFGEACLYTGAAAWAVEVTGIERSGRTLSYLSSGIWGGISLGPAVGQWLGSFERAAAMQVAAAAVAILVLTRVSEEYHPHEHDATRSWLPPGL